MSIGVIDFGSALTTYPSATCHPLLESLMINPAFISDLACAPIADLLSPTLISTDAIPGFFAMN